LSTSRPPVYYSGGPSLPYTGANVPLRAGLLSALGLLFGGAALILLAGRTAPIAGNRRP
jgi:hypothetical protein